MNQTERSSIEHTFLKSQSKVYREEIFCSPSHKAYVHRGTSLTKEQCMNHFQFNTITIISILLMAFLAFITVQQFWRMAKNPKQFARLKKWRFLKKKPVKTPFV